MKLFSITLISLVTIVLTLTGCNNTAPAPVDNSTPPAPKAIAETPDGSASADNNIESVVPGKPVVPENPTPPVNPPTAPQKPGFIVSSPVSVFSDADIDYLGVDCSGSDREIAEGILKWQEDSMIYASPDKGYHDAADPMHWNYFLPGIWSSKDIIYTHTDNQKVYGICHDYAVIFASIANYYGLECRVMNTLSKPGEQAGNESQAGMLREEYDRNKFKLDEEGLDYSYAAVNSVAEGTPTHYWAEVFLDGEWVVFDGTQNATGGNTAIEFIAKDDFEVTDWLSRDKTELLKSNFYVGITDDLGQPGRAATIDDLMKGFALAPYFNSALDARDYVRAGDHITESDLLEAMADKAAYESRSGKNFYLVCYFICDGDDLTGMAWVERYELYSGEKLDLESVADIIEP